MSDGFIPLKEWSDDDPEKGHLYVGLRVTTSESENDTPRPDVLVQPNIPNRLQRLAAIERAIDQEDEQESDDER
jgi:hypothetical protein